VSGTVSLGEAQLLAGRLEEAHALAKRALGHARTYQERGHEAYAQRLLGEIAAPRTPPESALAAAHYQQARTALSTAIDMYRTMEMIFWLPETEATLAQVDAR
jgi:hypothetical protein